MKAIVGTKIGMTQVFTEDGSLVPVTVVQAGPCKVIQKKTVDTDGYDAVQVGFKVVKENRLNKPALGQFKKIDAEPMKYLKEFRSEGNQELEVGSEYKVDVFGEGELIDVSGTSKGKGTQGVIARWGQSRGPMTHGSRFHRRPGAMSAAATPGRVLKGKKLPGRAGNEKTTIQNLEIVRTDAERNLILIKGAIPGASGGLVTIRKAAKA